MRGYFVLQFKMNVRKMVDFGLNPILGFLLLSIAFVGGTEFLYFKLEIASYIYVAVALTFLYKLSSTKRNDFLQTCFPRHSYFKLRLLENALLALPFLIYLVIKADLIHAGILSASTFILALVKIQMKQNYSFPTPFSKRPFEFAVGTRKTLLLFPLSWILTYLAIEQGNFNLGVFSILIIVIAAHYYFLTPENELYVWVHSKTSKQFLAHKIGIGIFHLTIAVIPNCLALIFFFPDDTVIVLLSLVVGYVYLTTFILAKFAAYPNEFSIPQAIIFTLCIAFPPFLLFVIPWFFKQAIVKLNQLLA